MAHSKHNEEAKCDFDNHFPVSYAILDNPTDERDDADSKREQKRMTPSSPMR
jgi:hypothetical protein